VFNIKPQKSGKRILAIANFEALYKALERDDELYVTEFELREGGIYRVTVGNSEMTDKDIRNRLIRYAMLCKGDENGKLG
jgi:hypothetical protein